MSCQFIFAQTEHDIEYEFQHEHKGCHHYGERPQDPVPGYLPPVNPDDTRSDSIDILNYTIHIDVRDPHIKAHTIVSAKTKVDAMKEMRLDLLNLQIDSIFFDDTKIDFSYDGFQMFFDFPQTLGMNEKFDITVYYQGKTTRDPSNFGGLVFEQGYIYNLGIGLASNPHNFGRGWFPCYDNFKERSTFEFNVTHSANLNAHCVGTEVGVVKNSDNSVTTSYVMNVPIATYHASIAVSDYKVLWQEHQGKNGVIPIKLIARPQEFSKLAGSFGNLPKTIDCIEDWYGPYEWERACFVATTVGAMEHPTNIAYPISSINGNAATNTRLMAHEFTHNWFGNVITLSTEEDMWIKEGPAEYGAHLATECIYGKEEFLEQVIENHVHVLKKAHVNDEEFRALSGMPNEFTYGTHTYAKGASVMHNLRGYLGDSLFQKGMRSILKTYKLSHLDAEQFRDEITKATGVDMNAFFEAWIFNPGFSVFVEDSIHSKELSSGLFDNEIFVHQKLYGTTGFHQQVPLSLHAYGPNGEVQEQMIMVSGEFDQVNITTDFPIRRIVFNQDNVLNQARIVGEKEVEKSGSFSFRHTDASLKVNTYDGNPYKVRMEHILGAPEDNKVEGDYVMTNKHYWRVSGDNIPVDNDAELIFIYRGKKKDALDYPMNVMDEDSMILLYRSDPSQLWAPMAGFEHKKGIPTDGAGKLRTASLQIGEYTVGRGIVNSVSTSRPAYNFEMELIPNPASNSAYLNFTPIVHSNTHCSIINLQGQLMYQTKIEAGANYLRLDTQQLMAGTYFVQLLDRNSGARQIKKMVIVK